MFKYISKKSAVLGILFALIYLPFYVVYLLTKQKKYW